MSAFLRKYATGTGADIYIPVIKRDVVDFAVAADWTPSVGDVKISIDGGTAANIGTLPVINGTHDWKFVFTDAELTGKTIRVRVVDSATKSIEDQSFTIETYGHASAMHPNLGWLTGDSYARLGAPAGTSVSADVAAKPTLAQILSAFGATTGAVEDHASNSTTQFQSNLAETADDYFNGSVVAFTSGTNSGQARRITDYEGSSGTITVSPAFDAEPDAADAFIVLGRID